MLEIKNLTCEYNGVKALQIPLLSFEKGKFTAIVGLNGSGKSTLLSCISLIKKYSGCISAEGRELKSIEQKERAKLISYLPQSVKAVPFTVEELVEFGRNPYMGENVEERGGIVEKTLKRTGIYHLRSKRVNEISGGERQLAYLSMIFCQNAEYMLLDEPTSGLDLSREREIYSLIRERCVKDGKTAVTVMHNLTCAVEFADMLAVVSDGEIVFYGSKSQFSENKTAEKYFGVKKYVCQDEDGEKIFFA